jgi:drug/metabolite transporter (DMT)-like permease
MTDRNGLAGGVALGCAASLAWGIFNVGSELGQAAGFRPSDLTVLRFGVAALLLLPVLVFARGAQQPPLGKVLVLAALVGPGFSLLLNAGFQHAPLSHAVVISPAFSMLTANALVHLTGRKWPSGNRLLGIAILLAGLVAIALDAPPPKTEGLSVLVGDLCFIASGTLWGCYVFAMGRWRLDPVRTTAGIATVSLIAYGPVWLIQGGVPDLPAGQWMAQAVFQGVIGGALAFMIQAATVLRLGAGRAALFSALVPPTAVLMAIPFAGVWPGPLQWASVLLATLGLAISLDLKGEIARPRPSR